jgi:CBS domain-containing protein
MTPDYVRIRPEWTVARALDHIRRYGRDAETINVVYVVDDMGVLIDDLRLRQLIMAEPDATVESQMNRQFVTLRADQPQEDAVELLQKYDRVAMPVIDSRGILLGIITHDDVADVAEQEATEDMQKLGGVQALEQPYAETPILGLVKKRAPWLALLFMSELLTSNAIAFFDGEIQKAAILAAFLRALDGLVAARAAEGERLRVILAALLDEIATLCAEAARGALAPADAALMRLWNLHALASPSRPGALLDALLVFAAAAGAALVAHVRGGDAAL